MSKRKELFKIKKNDNGHSIILAKFFLKEFIYNEKDYTELHIIADAIGVQLTLRNHKNHTVKCIGTSAMWDRRPGGSYFNRVNSVDSLKKAVTDLEDSFKVNQIPEWLGPLTDYTFGVLV